MLLAPLSNLPPVLQSSSHPLQFAHEAQEKLHRPPGQCLGPLTFSEPGQADPADPADPVCGTETEASRPSVTVSLPSNRTLKTQLCFTRMVLAKLV